MASKCQPIIFTAVIGSSPTAMKWPQSASLSFSRRLLAVPHNNQNVTAVPTVMKNVRCHAPGQFGRPSLVDQIGHCHDGYMGTAMIIFLSMTMPLTN